MPPIRFEVRATVIGYYTLIYTSTSIADLTRCGEKGRVNLPEKGRVFGTTMPYTRSQNIKEL